MKALIQATLLLLVACLSGGCAGPEARAQRFVQTAAAPVVEQDYGLLACKRHIEDLRNAPALPGAKAHDERRIEFIGRAKGAPVIFVEEPPPPAVAMDKADNLDIWLFRLKRNYLIGDRRKRLLRGGYLYSDDPDEAFYLVDKLWLSDLFYEQKIWLQRGEHTHELKRVRHHDPPYYRYQHVGGPFDGQPASLLFADRVAVKRKALGEPLHRDVRSLQRRVGFDQIRIHHRAKKALVADLRFGQRWIGAAIRSEGARLELDCLAASQEERQEMKAYLAKQEPYRRSIEALRIAVNAMVTERLPFDHPRHADDHLIDGRLRPNWDWAYFKRRHGFTVGGEGYPIFDRQGRPHPPQTCINMVVDVFERASGTWYRPAAQKPERISGGLDFDAAGLENRAGVLAFEEYAKEHPELFSHRRFREEERFQFRDRERFFGYLVDHAADFQAGDIVTIRGIKRDGNIHQHAILIEALDPLTGFASDLVDQRKRPKRLTWEGIMGEAPLRRLFFHLRPTDKLLATLDPERARRTLWLPESNGAKK